MGNRRMHRFDVAFDSSYPAGGETLSLGPVRMRTLDLIIISPTNGYFFEYDYDNNKIKVIAPIAEAVNSLVASVDPGGVSVTSNAANGNIITLTGTPGFDATAGGEVPNATNLAALDGVRCLAIGY
jgi:hypothetical protein